MPIRTPLVAPAIMTFITLAAATSQANAVAMDQYKLDASHTGIVFRVKHLTTSYTYGRFNDPTGQFTIGGDQSSFEFTVKTASIDTGDKKRDDHLRSPDFFNAKQFPVITFKSTNVEPTTDGYRVTGDLSLHGVTKSITVNLQKMGEGKDPWGNYRMGFSTELTIKRSDYGMTNMPKAVGDEILLMISFEGLKQ